MTTNLFVISNVKQLRTGGSFRNLLHFFRTSLGVGVLNSAIFISFHNLVEFCTILEGLRNFGWGGWTPKPPPLGTPLVYVTFLFVIALSCTEITSICFSCLSLTLTTYSHFISSHANQRPQRFQQTASEIPKNFPSYIITFISNTFQHNHSPPE